jgi:glycosyltransferase involved in cell wall biosynthesis
MWPLFSIITPSYNARAALNDTFESVMDQAPTLFEYWVIDGRSSDGTPEWLGERTEPWFHWISGRDAGVYDAMNKGIGLAQGRFLLFLGAGDILLPGSLKRVAEFIQQDPTPALRFIYGDVRDMQTGLPFTAGRFTKTRICRENICHQGIFYERSVFDLLGGYELDYPVLADWAFNLRCFGDPRILKRHLPLEVAEFQGGGLCSHTADVAFARDYLRIIAERVGALYAFRVRIALAAKRRSPFRF